MRRVTLAAALLTALMPLFAGAQAVPTASYAPGWNLVAGPAGSALIGAIGPLYTLQPGDSGYETVPQGTPLQSCQGYWAYFPNGGSLETAGQGGGACDLALQAGQSALLGNPSGAGAATLSGDAPAFGYSNAGYEVETSVPPGHAVVVEGPGQVHLSTAPATDASPVSVTTPMPAPVPATGPCFRNINGQIIHIPC